MSKSDVWMPLYIGDYLADTMHLSGPEHGAYLLLLMHSWRTGPLPDDDRALATIARTDHASWRRMAGTIRMFFVAADGHLVQARLERVRDEQMAKIEQRRTAGVASAAARARQRPLNERSTSVAGPLPRRGRELELDSEKKEDPPSPPSVVRSPRGSRLAEDWQPDAEARRFAADLGIDPDATAAQFRDFWRAKAGKDAVKLDWPATWRGWCRRDAERRPRAAGAAQNQSKLAWMHGMLGDDPEPPRFDLDLQAERIA